MKISTAFMWLTALTAWGQPAEKKTTSQIKEVTVFLEGAQVTRTASPDLPQGVSTLLVHGISPRINEQSIQVETGSATKIMSVSFRVNHLSENTKPEQVLSLEKEKKRLQELMDGERNNEAIYREEEAMLKANKEIGGTQGVNVNDLKLAVDYFRTRMTDIKEKLQMCSARMGSYQEEISRLDAQLVELKNRKLQPTGEIAIKVSTKTEGKATFKISYLVQEARWYPSYDIRAKDISSPIGITYKANVSQHSGEDWENVNLTISSANPTTTGARPLLSAWHLGFNNQRASYGSYSELMGAMPGIAISNNEVRGRVVSAEDGAPLPGVNVTIKGSSMGTVTNVNGEYSIPLTSDAERLVFSFIGMQTHEVQVGGRNTIDVTLNEDVTQLSETVVTGYATGPITIRGISGYEPRVKRAILATPVVRQTNIEYRIDEPYSILADGEMRTVEMIEYDINALYHYYCAPKLDTDAFLMAQLIDWDAYHFLEGKASLFFEGKYLGESILDPRQTDDTLTLSLGRDKNVTITREKVKSISSHQVLSGNRKVVFAYAITVRNKKQQALEIRIEDQVPVPNTKEITVDKLEDSNAEFSEDTGLLVWNKKLEPGQIEKIDLKYAVKYPRWSKLILE